MKSKNFFTAMCGVFCWQVLRLQLTQPLQNLKKRCQT